MARRLSKFSIHKLSYKSLLLIVVILLIGIVVLTRIVGQSKKVAAAWWDETWSYRVAVNIGNTSGSVLTNFQVNINIGTSAIINAGKMKSDCSDIRVTDINGNLLTYWVSACNSNATQIWPKITSIPTSGTTVYVYYGNPSATTGKTKTGTSDYPGLSCKSILDAGDSTGTGNYWIDPTNGDTSDKFQAYCDMTNDSGGWMLVTQSMINNEIGVSTTSVKTTDSNGGLIYTTTISAPADCSTHYGKFYLNDIIPWTKIKADYQFLGGNSCWAIFGNTSYSADTNLIQFALGTDTIRYQVKMGGSNGDNYDGTNTRCDNTTTNFWHSNQGVGTTRSAQVILRRNSMSSLAGLGAGTACVNSGYPWKYQNIYIREDAMTYAATAGTPASEEVSPAPIAYWKFDEGYGLTAYDSSSYSNNGTFGAGSSYPSWVSEDQCISGKCIFIPSTNKIVTSKTLTLPNQFTISNWIKTTASNGQAYSVVNAGGGNGYRFGIGGGKIAFLIGNASSYTETTCGNTLVNDNKWHHITGVYKSADKFYCYIDGKFEASVNIVDFTGMSNAAPIIGGWNGAQAYTGYLDDVKIYPYARTLSQIKSDYASGLAGQGAFNSANNLGSLKNGILLNGLSAYWKMDETISPALDSSGNANTVTGVGSNSFGVGRFGNGFRSGVGTTNYIANPSFETSSANWSYQDASQGSATTTTAKSLFGNYSLMVTRNVGGSEANVYNNVSGLAVSTTYYYSVWAWASTPGTACIFTYNGTSNLASVCHSGSSTWERIGGTFISSATGTIQLRLSQSSATPSSVYFDGAQVELGSVATPYIDGSLGTGYSWTGTAHASISVRAASSASTTSTLNNTSGTLSFWFNSPSLTTTSQCPLGSGNGDSTGGLFFALKSNGIAMTHVYSAGVSAVAQVNNTINNSTWNHVVYTWNNTNRTGTFYLNGLKQQTVSYAQAITIGEYLQNIGSCTKTGMTQFNGTIDDIRDYNRVLSPAEVSLLYTWSPGPVAYYDFNENTGNTLNDKSGIGNTGTWQGTLGSQWVAGKYGSAGKFNGTNNYLDLGNPAALNLTGNFTIETWINPTTINAGWNTIFGGGANDVGFGYQGAGNTANLRFTKVSAVDAPSSTATFNTNQWTHVAATFDQQNSILTYYINGVGATTIFNNTFTPSAKTVGKVINYSSNITASLDDLRIYNYARNTKQINEDMNANHPVTTSNSPLSYWKFNEGYGNITNNSGSFGTSLSAAFGAGASAPTWNNNGKYDKALSFTTGQYASYTPYFLENAKEVTISAWIRPTSDTYIFQYGCSSSYNGYINYFLVNSSGAMVMDIEDAVLMNHFTDSTSNGIVPMNQWSYVAVSVGPNNIRYYLNGKLIKTSNYFNGMYPLHNANTAYNNIGRYNYNNTTFNFTSGLIDELKVYNQSLNDDEIRLDYNKGSALQFGSLSVNTGNTAPPTASSQQYCVPGDNIACDPPAGEWNFEENVGTTAYDISGNNNNASLTGGATWTVGKNGAGLSFNGSTNYVTAPDPGINATNNFTIEFWMKNDPTVGAWSDPISFGNGLARFETGTTATSDIDIFNPGFTASSIVCTNCIIPNTWNHVALSVNSTNWIMYVNGQNRVSGTTTSTLTGSASLYFGARFPVSSLWKGSLDQVRIFKYSRSLSQIALDYNRGGPISWYKFDECQGNIAYNSSGMSNNGSINIGAAGTQTNLGTCSIGTSAAWTNGANGKYNASLNLDGTDDSVTLPNDIGLGNQELTVSAWVKHKSFAASGSSRPYVSDWNTWSPGSQKGFILRTYDTQNTPSFWLADGTNYFTVTSSKSISLNNWYHVVGVFKANSIFKIYINGVETGSGAAPAQYIKENTTPIYLGYSGINSGYFDGQLDDIKIFNYALTSTQIKTLYNNGAVFFGP